jgi:N,N'-diacetyllegionaminate synthase
MVEIKIGSKIIGENSDCFLIAEAGANHEGSIEKALELIDEAKNSGVDAIKFQTYSASNLTTKTAPKYWDDGISNETQFDVFSKLDTLTVSDWQKIFDYAKKRDILCFSTPFDEESVDLLDSLNVPAYKIASADITHLPLIRKVAKKMKPIFISTGMSTMDEIHDAISIFKEEGNNKIIIMHCITSYPTEPKDANLEMISILKKEFPEYIIGYSDHTLGIDIAAFSVLYGSKCIEKHFTYDKELSISRDHRLSLNADEFRHLKRRIQLIEISRGNRRDISFEPEDNAVKYARRSIVSKTSISKGTKITKDLLMIKRPGTGIQPKALDDVIGMIAAKDIDEDVPITWHDLTKK